MHDLDATNGKLMESWCKKPLSFLPAQPLDDVKDYFGERVGLYFAFMQVHLTPP